MKFSKYLIIMMQMLWRQLAPFSFPGNTEGKIEWHNQDGNPQQLFPVGGDDVWGTKENFYTTDPSSLSWNTFQQLLTIQQICLPVIHKDSLWAGYFGGKKRCSTQDDFPNMLISFILLWTEWRIRRWMKQRICYVL